MNTIDYLNLLPVPPGATADDWCWIPGNPREAVRFLTWARLDTDKTVVAVEGAQYADGRIERVIRAYGTEELTAADGRALARALMAAADKLDDLTEMIEP